MSEQDAFLQRCNLQERIECLRRCGSVDEIPEAQFQIDCLHQCRSGESLAAGLLKNENLIIGWPHAGDCRFGFCLDKKVEDLFSIKIKSSDFETQTFEPADDEQFTYVLEHKISALGFKNGRKGNSLGDLVYAYSWNGVRNEFWRWDEKEMDFLIPLKDNPLIWRECTENEAFRALSVQRYYTDTSDPGYVFGYYVTKKVGDELLRDVVNAARRGKLRQFVDRVLIPKLIQVGWQDFDDIIMRTHGSRDDGCEGWNGEKRVFEDHKGSCDYDMERWLGWMEDLDSPPIEVGFYPVWVPETLAYLIMNAITDARNDSQVLTAEQIEQERRLLAESVEYGGFQIRTFCGVQFGTKCSEGVGSLTKFVDLGTMFRSFSRARCDYTAFGRLLYRVSLIQLWFLDLDSAYEEINVIKKIMEDKYQIAFTKLHRDYRKNGAYLRKESRLVHRTTDTSGLLRSTARSAFVLFAERGEYQFARYLLRQANDTHYQIVVALEDANIYKRDDLRCQMLWKKQFAGLRGTDGASIL